MTYDRAIDTPAQYLIKCMKIGKIADFGDTGSSIEAELIRLLMLGLPLRNGAVWPVTRLPGIRIRGAKIKGALNLDDCRLPPDGLAALVLDDCDICDHINLHAARLARLSISRSRFCLINLREAEIDGPFTFDDSRPYQHNEGVAWIDARGCVIKGELTGEGAQLHAPGPSHRLFEKVPDRGADYALGLQNSDIRGNVSIIGLRAYGGISIASANIRGAVYANSTTLTGLVSDAFNAQNARVSGGLHLEKGCTSEGRVNLLGIHIGGALQLSGSLLSWEKPAGTGVADEDHQALVVDNSNIGTDLYLDKMQVVGCAVFEGCYVGGHVYASAIKIEKPWLTNRDRQRSALSFSGGRIGGDIDLRNSKVCGRVEAIATRVGGTFYLNETKIKASIANGHEIAFHGERLRSGGNIEFKGDNAGSKDKFYCEGEVNLCGAVVGRDLRAEEAVFHNPGRSAIYAKDMRVGSDLRLLGVRVEGHMNFERIEVNGTFRWDDLEFFRPEISKTTKLDLKKSRIGSALEAFKLKANAPLIIDFGGAKAATISSNWTDGWGNGNTTINFDGFGYERLAFNHPKIETLTLVKWLQRQHDPVAPAKSFTPQSYRQLAQVLRAQGNEQMARRVAVAERWAELGQNLRPVSRAYGFLFGFGYSRKRASATLIGYVLLGTWGINVAASSHKLVESSMLTAALSYTDGEGHRERAFAISKEKGDADEVDCTEAAQDLLDQIVYALDLVLPVIPLHQEAKCEVSTSRTGSARYWRLARALYSIVGWVLSSLFFLTFSGVLRPADE